MYLYLGNRLLSLHRSVRAQLQKYWESIGTWDWNTKICASSYSAVNLSTIDYKRTSLACGRDAKSDTKKRLVGQQWNINPVACVVIIRMGKAFDG